MSVDDMKEGVAAHDEGKKEDTEEAEKERKEEGKKEDAEEAEQERKEEDEGRRVVSCPWGLPWPCFSAAMVLAWLWLVGEHGNTCRYLGGCFYF